MLNFLAYRSMTFCGGVIHWLGRNKGDADDSLMAFDVNDEEFKLMILPPNLDGDELLLMLLNGLLTLFDFSPFGVRQGSNHCYIWVMREYGVMESWTKLFTILPHEIVRRPLGFTEGGKKVVFESDEGKLISCDLENSQSEILQVNGPRPHAVAVGLRESLALLEAGN